VLVADLVSLKRTPAEIKDEKSEMSSYTPPEYDYGTRLCFDDEALKKLGIGAVRVGDEMMLTARVRVVSSNESESENHKHRSADFQVTDAALEPAVDPNRKPDAQVFYGSK
jgi:hypothetical protein